MGSTYLRISPNGELPPAKRPKAQKRGSKKAPRTPQFIPNLTMDAPTDDVTVDPAPIAEPFRFMDLPAELRNTVYQHLILNGETLQFHYRERLVHRRSAPWVTDLQGRWFVDAIRPGRVVQNAKVLKSGCSSILLVNKYISAEAKAVIYAQNTFRFTIDGHAHKKNSLHSSLIFGPLGEPLTLPLLRNLRSVEIFIQLANWRSGHWPNRRQRGRLEHFVNIMKEHADDENKKSLLKNLRVVMTSNVQSTPSHYSGRRLCISEPAPLGRYMFACESLAELRGVEEVRIEGLPEWFTQCLQLTMEGKGGEPLEIEYPDMWVKRRVPNTKRKKAYLVNTKAWWQPRLNWVEFAERNGVKMPEGLDILTMGDPQAHVGGDGAE